MPDKKRKIKRALRHDQCPTCGSPLTPEQIRALKRDVRRGERSESAPAEPGSPASDFAYRPRTFADGND